MVELQLQKRILLSSRLRAVFIDQANYAKPLLQKQQSPVGRKSQPIKFCFSSHLTQ